MELFENEDGTASVVVGTTRYPFVTVAQAQLFMATLGAGGSNAAAEWQRGCRELLAMAEAFISKGRQLELLYLDNDLYPLVAGTPPDSVVPGTTWTMQRAIAVGCLMQDLMAFLNEPAVGTPIPAPFPLPVRRRIIMQRD